MDLKFIFRNFVTLIVCMSFIKANAEIVLPSLISDGMVLQREQKIKVWGWANPGEEVKVTFNNKNYTTLTNSDKKWFINLPKTKAGGPYSMIISSKTSSITIKDILVGDVWLCSGQSNMEFTMSKLSDAFPSDLANATNKEIRQFLVKQVYSFKPLTAVQGEWKYANPATIGNFSAVGYYMVKALYDKYKVPMGIIHASWGGTPAEAWTSEEGLKEFPHYLNVSNYFKEPANVSKTIRKDQETNDNWYKNLKINDKGFENPEKIWSKSLEKFNSGKVIRFPGFWEEQGFPDLDGVIWVRKEINLTEQMLQQDAMLELGMIDDSDSTYFNGIKIGSTNNKYASRKYKVPSSILKLGKNVIIIRIVDTDGKGGFIRDKNYRFISGTKIIDITGEWECEIGASAKALLQSSFTRLHYQPTSLYNAMIAPLIPYTIKGVAWCQGESNTSKPSEYAKLLSAMIQDWRLKWGQGDFPFLIVQLANYMEVKNEPTQSNWAELREAQLKVATELPNAALTVAIDVGETNDIHYSNKKAVGHRLALAAQSVAYHDNVVHSGPTYKSMQIKGDKIYLKFNHVGAGLVSKGDNRLSHFAIAGSDKKFIWAKAEIRGKKLIVWSENLKSPVAVRYAWSNNPLGCNLYNKDGLPASPFRTDSW